MHCYLFNGSIICFQFIIKNNEANYCCARFIRSFTPYFIERNLYQRRNLTSVIYRQSQQPYSKCTKCSICSTFWKSGTSRNLVRFCFTDRRYLLFIGRFYTLVCIGFVSCTHSDYHHHSGWKRLASRSVLEKRCTIWRTSVFHHQQSERIYTLQSIFFNILN